MFSLKHIAGGAATGFVVALLWLPILVMYVPPLWDAAAHHPALLFEALPLAYLPRFLFLNTLQLAALTALIAVGTGLPVGVMLARGPRWLRAPGALLTALPLALPPTLAASAWLELTRTPPARSQALLAASQPSAASPILHAGTMLGLCFFPVVAWAVWAGLLAIPAECEEAARAFDDGWGVWRRVLWPLLTPAILGAAGIAAALAMWEMGAPDLVDARTYSVQIYREWSAHGDAGVAALRSLPMFVLGALALWPAARAVHGYERRGRAAGAGGPSGAGEAALATMLAWTVLLLSPVSILGVFISQLRPPRVLLEVWSTNSVEIGNTAVLSTTSALAITAVATALVMAWRAWRPQRRRLAWLLCSAPVLFAPIMLGIAAINFYNRPALSWVYGGLPIGGSVVADWLADTTARYGMMWLGYAARFLPLAVILMYEAERRLDATQLEAAANLGAVPLQVSLNIGVPALKNAMLLTFAVVWALCSSELSMSVLVNAPGGQTLPVSIFNWMHSAFLPQVAALSLTLAAMSAVMIVAVGSRAWSRQR